MDNKQKCSECEANEIIIIKKARKVYCRGCWKYHCEFRFKKRLFEFGRPAKGTVGEVFKPADHTVICYDGSPTSVALINLALNALQNNNIRNDDGGGSSSGGIISNNLPFPFKFSIVVILESELNGSPGVESRQRKHLTSLQKWIEQANNAVGGGGGAERHFPLICSSLEMSLKEFHTEETVMMFNETPLAVLIGKDEQEGYQGLPQFSVDCLPLPFNESLDNHLAELRKSLKSKTDDKDFVGVLKNNLLCSIANQLNVSKILLPEDQTSLAVKMFTMMSLGRGSQIADEMAFTTSKNCGICVGRPLIDFSDEDLKGYLDTLGSQLTDGIFGKGVKRKMKVDSVDRQCDDFIVNLQKGYPATVSTLTRIGAKLQSNNNKNDIDTGLGSSTSTVSSNLLLCRFCKKQLVDADEHLTLCFGCQHFIEDKHPQKKEYFKNLFQMRT